MTPGSHVETAAAEVDISRLPRGRTVHWGRLIAAGLLLCIGAFIVNAFVQGAIRWSVVAQYLAWPTILHGLLSTLVMSVAAMGLATVLGVVIAVSRSSANPVLYGFALFYTWLFRGVPLILQLLLWFNLALIFPKFGIPGVFSVRMIDIMTPFTAALLGLGLSQAAYVSEIVRAGMLAVDPGQYEAAKSIGLTYRQSLQRIVLPQAMRVIVPPMNNEFINMVKATALASVIQYTELLYSAENIYLVNNQVIEMLLVAAFWYLLVVSILSLIQQFLENHMRRSSSMQGRRS